MQNAQASKKRVISAGEVGVYTVCPESWRLKMLTKVARGQNEQLTAQGQRLHKEWTQKADEASYILSRIRFVLLLLVFAVLLYFVR